jgi:PAS domain S-box-containing protein
MESTKGDMSDAVERAGPDGELARLRQVLDAASDAYLCGDAARLLVDCNRAAESLFGWSRAELVGRPAAEVLDPDDHRDENARLVHSILATPPETPGHDPVRLMLRRRDGSLFDAEVSFWTTGVAGDRLLHSLVRDVTERVRLTQELTEQTERLVEAQRIAGVGSWTWRPEDDAITWSAELYRIFGVDRDAVVNYTSFTERLHPEGRAQVEETIQAALEAGEDFSFDARIVRDDGSIRWIRSRGTPSIELRDGARLLIGTVQDITERKLVEIRAARAEARFRAAFEHSTLGMLLWCRDDGTVVANRAAGDMLGRNPAHLSAKDLTAFVHPDDAATVVALVEELLSGERPSLEQ